MDMDLAKVSELLAVVEKCAAHGGKFAAIANAATARLVEVNESLRQEAVEAVKAARVAEAEANHAAFVLAAQRAEEAATATDPTPVRESETDKIAKSNMRRA